MTVSEIKELVLEATKKFGAYEVEVDSKGLQQYVFKLQFPWYVLPTSLMRDRAYDKAREVIEANKDKGMTILVAVR